MKLELDDDVMAGIVVAFLQQDLDMVNLDITKLETKKRKPHEEQDLLANLKIKNALETVLGYYGN